MKKLFAILLAFALVLSLGACSALKDVEGTEQPQGNTEPAPAPDENTVLPPEMDTELEALGSQVIVSLKKNQEVFKAPDGTDRTILTFSYDTTTVHIEGNDAASDRINTNLNVLEETFYSGTGMGDDGVGGMLEQATDNFAVAMELKDDRPLEFTSSRAARVLRSDSRILSLVYQTQVYNGGVNSTYHDRAYVFDTQTGDRLTLAALCDTPENLELLKAAMLDKMIAQAREENSGVDLSQFEEEGALENALSALIREATWYLDDSGLTVFSNVYELGGYDAGIISFSFSYEDICEYLSSKWLPTPRAGDGAFSVDYVSDVADGAVKILGRVEVDPDGDDICLIANGTLYDVTIISVDYVGDSFFETAQHWACSYMHDCAIQLAAVLPEGMPDVMIRYTSSDGSVHNLLITQSGEDGSLILSDDGIAAVG